jgi:hypothetical protein
MTKAPRKVSKTVSKAKRSVPARAQLGVADGLRRKVYKTLPASSWSLVQQIEPGWSFAKILAHFAANPKAGVDSRGAARAMQQACTEAGLRSWCYEFGDPRHFTHMVLLVEEGGKIFLHDPYLDLVGAEDFLTILDRVEAGEGVDLISGLIQRPYLADPKLEVDAARKWLKLKSEDQRGTKLHVRGGLDFLENTVPAYRELLASSGTTDLSEHLVKAIALLNPAGLHEDVRFLAERLGLIDAPAAPASGKASRSLLTSRSEEAIELARAAQQKLGVMLDQLNAERTSLTQDLAELRNRHTDTLVELATLRETSRAETTALRETTRVELMRAAQARMAAEEETLQTKARLDQLKAEIDDRVAESQRIQELLNVAEGDKRNLLTALDASEAERQQLAAAAAAVAAEAEARAAKQAQFAATPRSLLPALTVGAAATVRPDGSFAVKGRRGGCICYGPYLDLAPGTYQLEIDCQRPAVAGWLRSHAIVEVVDGSRFLYSSQMKLGGGRTKTAITFEVPASDQMRQIEFRILVKRNSFAVLRDLRLEARD